jgi:diacylglycerol kinase (ATP)
VTRSAIRPVRPGGETLPFGMPLLIGDGAASSSGMTELRRALAGYGIAANSSIAHTVGQARRTALAALADGTRFLVAVGGDRVAHELVEAIAGPEALTRAPDDPAPDDGPVLGLVGLGRQDLAATFGLPEDPAEAARHLLGGNVFSADLGRARWHGGDGEETVGVFANAAELGYPAEVSSRQPARLPARLARVGRLASALTALRRTSSTPARLTLAHASVDLRLSGLIVANGQFSMGRSKVAPRALPDDGRLNVIAFEGEPLGVYAKSGRIYFGDHVPDPTVREYQSPTVEIDSAEPLAVALDGVPYPGGPPASFDVLRDALRIKV